RQRNIGVGRCAINSRPHLQMRIHRLYGPKQQGIGRESTAGSCSQFLYLRGQSRVPRVPVLRFERPFYGAGQEGREFIQNPFVFRAQIELRESLRGNRIYAGATLNDAEIIGKPSWAVFMAGLGGFDERADDLTKSVHGINGALVVPAKSARSLEIHLVTTGGTRPRTHMIERGAIENHAAFAALADGGLA